MMPKIKPNESRDDFISRCIPVVMDEGTAESKQQAVAICNSMWDQAQESKTMGINDQLLEAIRARQQKHTEFNYGILTADRYVKTLQDIAGLPTCYRCASSGMTSFDDVMQKAAQTLVYSNDEMVVEEKKADDQYTKLSGNIDFPKDTLMVFRHTLTTSRKDRDGDILRTDGMTVDPKMLLLWQHVHTMPIGKMLAEVTHDANRLVLLSCIVDMNEVSHDAAVMVDNDMGRFSHGFRAMEFDKNKADGEEGGFDIKRGEIMEESLVSVPANIDAGVEDILLSLVEGGKLTSPMMKSVGRTLREHRPVRVPVTLALKMTVNGQEIGNENKPGDREGTKEGKQPTSPSAKADVDDKAKAEETEDDEMKCPKCGSTDIKDGVCQECGYKFGEEEEKPKSKDDEEKEAKPECGKEIKPEIEPDEEKEIKAGRVISKANEQKIKDAKDDVDEASGMEGVSRPCKALLGQASRRLTAVLSSIGSEGMVEEKDSLKESMSHFICSATHADRKLMKESIEAMDSIDRDRKRAEEYRSTVGANR